VSDIISNELSRRPSLVDVESDAVMLPVHTLLLHCAVHILVGGQTGQKWPFLTLKTNKI
jgi:hypothetical protein